MKVLQNGLFRSCAARFGVIAVLSVKVLKIDTLVWSSLQNRKTVRFLWKVYKTLFSGHAEHGLAKSHLWVSKFSKSSPWPEILFKTGKQCAFYENCTKWSFQVMRSTFWPNRILSVKVLKIVTLAWNSRENRKQSAFHKNCTKRSFQVMGSTFWPNRICERQSSLKSSHWPEVLAKTGKERAFHWKFYKTLFSGHAEHGLAKSDFWPSKFSNSSHWPEILFKTGKQCAFHENCKQRFFQVMESTFCRNRICERQSS